MGLNKRKMNLDSIGVPFGASIIFGEEMSERRIHEDTRSFKRTEIC